jgi:hypothetical protein
MSAVKLVHAGYSRPARPSFSVRSSCFTNSCPKARETKTMSIFRASEVLWGLLFYGE